MNVLRGFATTFKHVLEQPVTIQYPEQVRPFKDRYKGRHVLRRYDNGLEKCIGCSLCERWCPWDAIDMVPPTNPVPIRVTYQDACHLVHGQGIRQQPRKLLRMIPGLELVEMQESDVCCGSAGIYNLTQPEKAGR